MYAFFCRDSMSQMNALKTGQIQPVSCTSPWTHTLVSLTCQPLQFDMKSPSFPPLMSARWKTFPSRQGLMFTTNSRTTMLEFQPSSFFEVPPEAVKGFLVQRRLNPWDQLFPVCLITYLEIPAMFIASLNQSLCPRVCLSIFLMGEFLC